jgi:hypothetical protein
MTKTALYWGLVITCVTDSVRATARSMVPNRPHFNLESLLHRHVFNLHRIIAGAGFPVQRTRPKSFCAGENRPNLLRFWLELANVNSWLNVKPIILSQPRRGGLSSLR